MPTALERRRVLVAARPAEETVLTGLFWSEALADWEPLHVESFDRARFTLQHTACDVLLVDEGLYHSEGAEGLAWLAQQHDVPTLFLAGCEAETCARAYGQGAAICLPRTATLEYPPLLAAALRRAAGHADLLRGQHRTRESLRQSRKQVDRLVNLLWRTAPLDTHNHWCTQRHILERLQEEVARTTRHGSPLTVAVAEVQTEGQPDEELTGWVTEQVARIKRRCDVAGQYGVRGFLLLLVQTPREGGVACCRRLEQTLEEQAACSPHGPLRACFGLASYSPETSTPQALLRAAEQHLDAARAVMSGSLRGEW
ncbi:MAG: hypothetical protein L0Z62_04170 [Gemmataceae bacterium]|nr:hypothetical protein [Gemmataceae bacterium]